MSDELTEAERIIWAYRFKTYREHELEAVVERGGELSEIARAEMAKRRASGKLS